MIHRHVFCSCDLHLCPMTLIHELDLDILKMYIKMNFVGQSFQKSEPYAQTDTQTDAIEHIT